MLFAETTTDYAGLALVITAVGSLITVVVSSIGAVFAILGKWKSDQNALGLAEVKLATDGLTSKLVEATAAKNISEGREQGRAEQKAEGKLDAADARVVRKDDVKEIIETTAGISGKLEDVKVISEDTNKRVIGIDVALTEEKKKDP